MRRKNEWEYQVKDYLTEAEFLLPVDIARFARKLDGQHSPYTVDRRLSREEVDSYLEILHEHELIRDSRVLFTGFGSICYSLWFPKRTLGLCLMAKGYTLLLNVLWIPILLLGTWLISRGCAIRGERLMIPGLVLGVLAGAFLHEFSHLCAGVCHGAYVFEMGVMLDHFMPGAYVLMEHNHIKSRRARLHIFSAGIKANLFLAGLCCVLTVTAPPELSGPLLMAAVGNGVVGLANTAFARGLDGMRVMSCYLGTDDLDAYSSRLFWDPEKRAAMWTWGRTGKAVVILCAAIRMAWLVIPLLWIVSLLDLVEVIY